jgi:subtilisin family serine protease
MERALRGFSVSVNDADARALAVEPGVAYVEPDHTMTLTSIEKDAPWAMDRLDQRALPLDHLFTSDDTGGAGAGVNAYILDAGIRKSHFAFQGRASYGPNEVGDGQADSADVLAAVDAAVARGFRWWSQPAFRTATR